MKKSFRLFLGTLILGFFLAGAGLSKDQPESAGGDPVPLCPPGGCAIS